MRGSEMESYQFDAFHLDPAEHRLLHKGQPVPLEPKVFETLLVLVRRRGSLVAKDELMEAVWPDAFVEESNLTRNISVLRKALNPTHSGTQYIETVPRLGYRFVGDVRVIPTVETELIVQSSRVAVVVEEEESDGESAAESTGLGEDGWQRRTLAAIGRHKTAVALAFAVGLVAAVAAMTLRSSPESGRQIDSLAVLPFVNASADPRTEYLSDGITDGLIDRLSQAPGLRVLSHYSVFSYKGRAADAKVAGEKLGVGAVLTGEVVARGDSLSVFAELIDVRDNSRLWGGRYDRKLSDTPALQAEFSRDISDQLQLHLSGEQRRSLTKRATGNPEAYALYLKGRYSMNILSEEGLESGLEYFQRAVELDPGFAAAHAGIAEAYTMIVDVVVVPAIPAEVAIPRAKAAASRAVDLDESLPDGHVSLARIAMIWDLDWGRAEREFRRAIELSPSNVHAHHLYSHYLMAMGRFDESLVESERAIALDPLDSAMNAHLGLHFIMARDYESAITQLERTLERNPSSEVALGLLGLAFEQAGSYDEAITVYQRAMERGGGDLRGNLAHAYAASGRRDEAERILGELLEEAKSRYVSPWNVALIYAGLGDADQMFAWLEEAYGQRDSNIVNMKVRPDFDAFRSDPRFTTLLEKLGLSAPMSR